MEEVLHWTFVNIYKSAGVNQTRQGPLIGQRGNSAILQILYKCFTRGLTCISIIYNKIMYYSSGLNDIIVTNLMEIKGQFIL